MRWRVEMIRKPRYEGPERPSTWWMLKLRWRYRRKLSADAWWMILLITIYLILVVAMLTAEYK